MQHDDSQTAQFLQRKEKTIQRNENATESKKKIMWSFFFYLLHYLEFSFEIQGWKKAAGIDFHLPPCFEQNLILQLILAKYSNRLLRGTSGENFCRTVITITVTVTVIAVVVVVIKAFPSRGFPILYSLGPHVHSLPHHPRLSPDGTLSQLINLHRHITIKKKNHPKPTVLIKVHAWCWTLWVWTNA